MSSKPARKAAFERMSVERYRQEVGLAPRTTAARSTAAPSRGTKHARVRGGPLPVLSSSSRRSARPLANGSPSEDDIHRDCADWVFANEDAYPILVWLMHVPNGGLRSRGEAGKLKAMGVRKGVSDWILPFPSPSGRYKGLAIELKSEVGTVSDEQEDFLHEASRNGWLIAVARSRDLFISTVKQWLLDPLL